MTARTLCLLLGFIAVAGCAAVPSATPSRETRTSLPAPPPTRVPAMDPAPPSTGFIPPTILEAPGLDRVIGRRSPDLLRLFGAARLETPEGDAMKLQFAGSPCVLDVFLYPLRPGGEPVATHVEARRGDGEPVDRAACVNALARR
ncbi:MAG: hypothetical protein V2I39_06095 [Erythrobacter sp.]|nr:hypothetical protein [Erythrobacter sp.]